MLWLHQNVVTKNVVVVFCQPFKISCVFWSFLASFILITRIWERQNIDFTYFSSETKKSDSKGHFTLRAMRKSEEKHRRTLLSHWAQNVWSPSANSHLHARWHWPTMHFSLCMYLVYGFNIVHCSIESIKLIKFGSSPQSIYNAYKNLLKYN